MFTVLFALLGLVVFVLTLAFTKFNFKQASLNTIMTIAVGLLTDIVIGGYFISLAHLSL